MYGEKTWRQLHKNAASNIEQILEAAHHKTATVRPPTTLHENYQSYRKREGESERLIKPSIAWLVLFIFWAAKLLDPEKWKLVYWDNLT